MRRVLVPVLLVLTGVLLFVGGLGLWAHSTIYSSSTFARRATSILDSQAVRKEVAERLTTELVRAGNQQAISFRPAFEAAIEAALDTDTVRSIFRNAIRTVHADVLRGGSGSSGINLSDSISVITSTLQLPSDARGSPIQEGGFATTFADTTEQLASLGVWSLESTVEIAGYACLAGAVLAAAAAIALADDRRRVVWWLGWVLVAVGVFAAALLWVVQWYIGTRFSDPELSAAVSGGISDMTVDLRTLALWTVAYGVVIAGAAAAADRLYTPAVVARRIGRWLDDRRQTSRGTLLVGLLGLLLGLVIIQNLAVASVVLAVVAGLWLTYLGTAELLRLIRRVATSERARRSWWRPVVAVGVVLLVLAGLTAGLIITTSRSAADASDSVPSGCNGSDDLCDLRLDQVMFAATHNSMSSPLYPGWLFGEQIGPIGDQLNSGVRALLFDTHYGIPSRARMPGSQNPIVLTDRARELAHPSFEQADPGVVDRANTLAARAPKAVDARSGLYLCHNYCELGAVSFPSVLQEIKDFVETHPDDVIIIDIQDATTPADTAQAFIDAGLEEHIATLKPGEPLPTLQELIDAGTTVIVFAEDGGGGGAPAWYQPAYQGWVQETPFKWDAVNAFDCGPNRGGTDGELFLINHWVTTAGPSPSTARQANADDIVRRRLERCIDERGKLPNIVAVDYAQTSDLVDQLAELNLELLDQVPDDAEPASPSTTEPPSTTAAPSTTAPASTTTPSTLPSVEEGQIVTTLTGGDPGRFCPTINDVVASVTGYAEAVLTEPASQTGRSDLAFAPYLVRALTPYLEAAPIELYERADPLRQRAEQAMQALTQLGLDDRDVAALATQAADSLSGSPPTDGATVQAELLDVIAETVTQQEIDAAAAQLSQALGDPGTLLDLGFVPSDVAANNGYNCVTDGE